MPMIVDLTVSSSHKEPKGVKHMGKNTQEIIQKAVHEAIDVYLCGKLAQELERRITSSVVCELANVEPEKTQAEKDFRDCVNELCLRCGKYRDEHNGACDGCRWLTPRRGW
jgi:hypothetical protein